MKTLIGITAIWTRRSGDHVETLVEMNGEWKLVSRDHIGGQFSHIAEGNGFKNWKDDPLEKSDPNKHLCEEGKR